MSILNEFIQSSMLVEESHTFRNMTIHFIKGNSKENGIINYSDAMIAKVLDITEIGEGNVPEVTFDNRAVFPVFVAGGTIIEGLKQSRSVYVSCVIDKMSKVVVPVNCIEQGRWHSKTKYGNISPFHISSRLRASNLKDTNKSLKERDGYNSGDSQSNTWRNIQEMKERKERQLCRG